MHYTFFGTFDPTLDREISLTELSNCTRRLKLGKASGSDGITGEFLRSLPEAWLIYLHGIFNKILDTEILPKSWSKILLFMLHKKGDRSDPLNYRGIALINVLTKIFTQIICDRLTVWIGNTDILPEEQSGFRKDRGASDNLFTLFSAIHIQLRRKGSKTYALFVDFKRAFDSIPQQLLWLKLYRLGISSKIIRIIKSLYDAAKLCVRSTTGNSEEVDVTEGVLQGEILSPLLFIIFLADITKYFRDNGVRGIDLDNFRDLLMLLYADDIVLFAYSSSDLRRKLKIFQNYCTENGLTVNTSKTKIIVFRAGGGLDKFSKKFEFNGNTVEVKSSYAYLGVEISCSARGLQAAKAVLAKTRIATSSVLSILGKAGADSWEGMLTVYRSVVASTLLYSAPIWGLCYLDQLEKAQVEFFKRLFLLPKNTAGYALRLELGLNIIAVEVVKLALGWVIKLLEMKDFRLPRICFFRLVYLAESGESDISYNWFLQLKKVLEGVHADDLWSNLRADYWRSRRIEITNEYAFLMKQRDLDLSVRSSSAQLCLFRHVEDRFTDFYPARCPIAFLRTKLQVRLANSNTRRLIISDTLYSYDPSQPCLLCNLNANETILHILAHCPTYADYRERLFKTYRVSSLTMERNLRALLNLKDLSSLKAIHCCIASCFKLRAIIMCE